MCVGVHMGTCTRMCMDMCRYVHEHVYGRVYGHAHRHVYGHVYRVYAAVYPRGDGWSQLIIFFLFHCYCCTFYSLLPARVYSLWLAIFQRHFSQYLRKPYFCGSFLHLMLCARGASFAPSRRHVCGHCVHVDRLSLES